MKKKIRHILHLLKRKVLYENKIVPKLYLLGCKLHLFTPMIMIQMDGGICSQMHQYLLGRYYARRGMRVVYNLGWFVRNGKDNNGIHTRLFELTKLFPNLDFEKATGEWSAFYATHFSAKRNGTHFPLEVQAPAFLPGYYFYDDNKLYAALFREYFNLSTIAPTSKHDILDWEGTKCAIHVRRGDLAKMNDPYYGKVTESYFRSSIEYILSHFNHVKLFFFSDELDWVENHLSDLYDSRPHCLVRGNAACEDLNLMAHCDCFISSQGSAGKFAAMINGNGLLIISDDPHESAWVDRHSHVHIEQN